MPFSTYARRYGLLRVVRVRWHSRASQLPGRIVAEKVNGNTQLKCVLYAYKYATEGNENEKLLCLESLLSGTQ